MTDSNPSNPPLRLLICVALISAAVMGFEISLSRVFAVLLRYHFAFLVISIALCGLGIGGFAAHWIRRVKPLPLPTLAISFGVAVDLAMAALLWGVFAHFPTAYWVGGVIILIPFSLAGIFLAECFSAYPERGGQLYAWDLIGASLATIATVLLLQLVSAIDACLFVGCLACACALIAPRDTAKGALPQVIALIVLVFAFIADSAAHFLDIPAIPPSYDAQHRSVADIGLTQELFTELGTPGETSKIIDTRWNAFARTDIVRDTSTPQTLVVYMNGSVPTNMIGWDGKLADAPPLNLWFPLSDWAYSVAPLGTPSQPHGRVLSIGPGGGLDALLALEHGASQFDGAELNPAILPIMSDYAKYNGHIYDQPNIHVHTAEGRAFVRDSISRGVRYDLIYSALTKTATAGQGTALLESFVYTTDAIHDYLSALTDKGQLILVTDNPLLTMRFAISAIAVLKSEGISEPDACKHLALAMDTNPGPYRFEMVFQKSALSPDEVQKMATSAQAHRVRLLYLPGVVANNDYGPIAALANGQMNIDQFVDWYRSAANAGYAYDLSPCPDDRPYVLDVTVGVQPVFEQMAVFCGVLALVVALIGWAGARKDNLRGDPGERPLSLPLLITYLCYFGALGVGFMLIEIPFTEKLILPLGYPTLALTVILFSILIGGGLGAWFSQTRSETSLAKLIGIAAFLVAVSSWLGATLLSDFSSVVLGWNLTLKCVAAAVVLLPLGFLLGIPFPSGIRLFGARHHGEVALIWGLNGVASVVGSLSAAMIGKACGYNAALEIGGGIYCVAAVLALTASKLDRGENAGATRNPAEPVTVSQSDLEFTED